MTAEVAVVNRHAIALAADSAVTVHGEKVFNTANKIFALSYNHPVALMVYGSGDLMGVPWETLAKLYRAHLGSSSHDTLDSYVDGLTGFLNGLVGSPEVFGEADQENHLRLWAGVVFGLIRDQISQEVDRRLGSGPLSSDEVQGLVARKVATFHAQSQKAALRDSATEETELHLSRTYASAIAEVTRDVFERLPMDAAVASSLEEIGVAVFTRSWLPPLPFASGVVVAGYGTDDVFPRLRELEVLGIVGGHLLYDRQRKVDIGTQDTARVMPFAQQEMVYRFMEGIDPGYRDFIEADFEELWLNALAAVVDGIAELADEQKTHYKRVATRVGKVELRGYLGRLREYSKANFADPVMDIVASLPKDELAELAESLVNLTSLRLRLSSETETVGGPIDVAVISKGDGLVWIKRKQYFGRELNPQFLARYVREASDGTTEP